MRYEGKEDDFQKSMAAYLDTIGAFWCHVANEAKIPVHYRKKLADKGQKAGVPDILIFDRSHDGKCNGLALELKAKYNKPSEAQLEWLHKLSQRGWQSAWTNDIDEAIRIVNSYYCR